jgi:hypothetical protein
MNVVQRPAALLSLLGATMLGVLGAWLFLRTAVEKSPAQAPLISLEKMGHLVSVKLNYSDVVEFNQNRTLGIPWSQWQVRLGGTKVLLVAKGDCTVATNLGGATYKSIDRINRTLTVVLPSPQPLNARINHDTRQKGGSYFYAITSNGVQLILPDSTNRVDAIDNALRLAQKDVYRVCSQPEVLATARENAENVLRASFHATQWTPTFVWH